MAVEKHHMIREVHEGPDALRRTLEDKGAFRKVARKVAEAAYSQVFVTGCGTSLHAGIAAAYALFELAGVAAQPIDATEMVYAPLGAVREGSLVIAISQSGETTDTLRAVRAAKGKKADILGVTNFPESSLAKEAKYLVLTKAGEEKAVVATKTYIAQLGALYAFTVEYASALGKLKEDRAEQLWRSLEGLPDKMKRLLGGKPVDTIKEAARFAKAVHNAFVLGVDVTYPTALEVALKLKEGTLMHGEAFSAPEFRHGPISLVDSSTLIVALYPPPSRKEAHSALHSVVKECKEAGATVFVVASEGDSKAKNYADYLVEVPATEPCFASVTYVVPGQLLTYYTAIAKGLNPDKPRRLVKVVKLEEEGEV